MISELILSAFCKAPKYEATSETADPLYWLEHDFPGLTELVRGREVLDFGCGLGAQAAALAARGAIVTGLDTNQSYLTTARERYPRVRFTERLDREKFDLVVSQDAMEHFTDPRAALLGMASALKSGGRILMAFGPPWYAPYGSHMHFFCRIPWLQLWFREKTVMKVRSRYRSDGAMRYEDVESGLNKMSLRKFERLISEAGLVIWRLDYIGVKKLNLLTKVPLIRELTTVHVVGVFSKE